MVYGIQFHTKSPRRVHTFWFTDKAMADKFLASVKRHPKVVDYCMHQIPVNEATEYDGVIEPGRILPVDE